MFQIQIYSSMLKTLEGLMSVLPSMSAGEAADVDTAGWQAGRQQRWWREGKGLTAWVGVAAGHRVALTQSN